MSNESLREKIVLKNKQIPWMRSIEFLKMIINSCFQLIIVRVLLKDKNTELNYTTGKIEIHFHNSL